MHLADVGDLDAFVDYIAKELQWSLQLELKAAKSEDLEDDDDFVKELALLKRRAETKGLPKSRRIVFDTYDFIRFSVWSKINTLLKKLTQELFYEGKVEFRVDNNLCDEYSNAIGTLEINVPVINEVSWVYIMCDLKGAHQATDILFYMRLSFKDYEYSISLELGDSISPDNSSVFSTTMAYNTFVMEDEIQQMTKSLKSKLLELIKSNMNN